MRKSFSLLGPFFLLVILSRPAYAYLDPGTGSMIVQVLLGGVAGVLVVGRLYWQRIKEFFGFKTATENGGDVEKRKGDQD